MCLRATGLNTCLVSVRSLIMSGSADASIVVGHGLCSKVFALLNDVILRSELRLVIPSNSM